QLDVAIAALERLLGVEGDGVRLAVAQQARVRGQVGARTAAEQPVERQPRELAGDVPERDVDAGERVDGRPVAPDTVQQALEVVVDRGDLRRVAAHAQWAEHGVDGRARRGEDPVAERLTPAADTGVGVDAHQQHVDAGHRAVAQLRRRPLDDHRQVDDERLDAGDLHAQNATGSDFSPRSVRLWRYSGRSVASASFGRRLRSVLIAIWPSMRASG